MDWNALNEFTRIIREEEWRGIKLNRLQKTLNRVENGITVPESNIYYKGECKHIFDSVIPKTILDFVDGALENDLARNFFAEADMSFKMHAQVFYFPFQMTNTFPTVYLACLLNNIFSLEEVYQKIEQEKVTRESVHEKMLKRMDHFNAYCENVSSSNKWVKGEDDKTFNYNTIDTALTFVEKYKVSSSYTLLIHKLAMNYSISPSVLQNIETSIRLRKLKFIDDRPRLKREDGCEYVAFNVKLKTVKGKDEDNFWKVQLFWFKVGTQCALPECDIYSGCSERLPLCSSCKNVCYCSLEHQKEDWKRHRKFCKGQ